MRSRFTLKRLFIVVGWLAVCTWLAERAYRADPKLWPLIALTLGSAAASGAAGLVRGKFADWLAWGLAVPVVIMGVLLVLGW